MRALVSRFIGTVAVTAAIASFWACGNAPEQCDVCYRPMHAATFYRVHLQNGDTMDVCCPRCGLRFQQGRKDVARAEVTDFNSQSRLDAAEAFYVEDSPVHFCSHAAVQEDRSGTQYEVAWDRCLPSLIAFESRAAADAFRRQNGGTVKTYEELLMEPY